MINAIFFAGAGRRVLPATPGRTTMCPVELFHKPSAPARLSLLPIETRLRGLLLSDLRKRDDSWQHVPLEIDNPEALARALQAVTPTQRVSVETATAPGEVTDSVISWASTDDQNLGAGEAILGATLAQRLGVAQLDLQPEIEINGAPVRVVGLLTESSSGTAPGAAFVTPETAAHLPPSRSSILYAQTVPGAARQLADRLTVIADPYAAWTWTIDPVLEADAYRGRLEDSISASLLVLAVVASLAGLVGVVFVNVLSVNARTAELGVRRAFGARRGDLIALVLGESTLLGVIGSVLGVAVGFVVIMGVTAVQRWSSSCSSDSRTGLVM